MDRVEIKDQNFALTSDSLRLMQQAWESLQQLAMLGAVDGNANYILSGCEQVGNVVSPGVVVLNGEVLPFAGGAANEYISAAEQTEVVAVGSGSYTKVVRFAQWGAGTNQQEWATIRNKRPSQKYNNEIFRINPTFDVNGYCEVLLYDLFGFTPDISIIFDLTITIVRVGLTNTITIPNIWGAELESGVFYFGFISKYFAIKLPSDIVPGNFNEIILKFSWK